MFTSDINVLIWLCFWVLVTPAIALIALHGVPVPAAVHGNTPGHGVALGAARPRALAAPHAAVAAGLAEGPGVGAGTQVQAYGRVLKGVLLI